MGNETVYDGLRRPYQSRSVIALAAARYTGGQYNYRDPQPNPELTEMSGGNDGVITMSHSLFGAGELRNLQIGTHQFATHHTDTDGIDLVANNDYIRSTAYNGTIRLVAQ